MQIHIVGQYPPPIGGITIHIKRLVGKLAKDNFDVKYFDDTDLPPMSVLIKLKNVFKKNPYTLDKVFGNSRKYNFNESVRLKSFNNYLFKLLLNDRNTSKIIHYHTKYWKYRAMLALISTFAKKVKIILTIHSMRDEYSDFNWITKLYINTTLKGTSHIIVTNNEIKTKLLNWGADQTKITVLHPFLSPEKSKEDYDEIPKPIWEFLNSNSPIISANASKIEFFDNNDLYGLDLCIELCYRLKSKYKNIGFVFCLPMIGRIEYFKELKERIKQYDIDDNFLFVLEQYEFYPFLEKSDLFVRPTNTDGDALSIREALSMNIPVVSSNAIERPEGTIIFKNRDIKDFEEKVLSTLQSNGRTNTKISNNSNDEAYNKIIEIYERVAKNI